MRWTARSDGDARPRRETAPRPWPGVAGAPVCWLRQVHGDSVVVVEDPDGWATPEGDALVTARPGVALGVLTADCAPVALASPEGVVAAAHAGWAGLAAGVLARTVEAMRALGAGRVEAALGPCIHPECYAFGTVELDRLAGDLGDGVRATTSAGAPALDLPAAVSAALARAGGRLAHVEPACTSCARAGASGFGYYSHRARREAERQAMVVWRA